MLVNPGCQFKLFSGGPDGIRTRDLGLDRAACLAATPRDQLTERAIVYHEGMSMSIRASSIKRRICGCLTSSIMDVYPISFDSPVEKPVRITNGQVDTSMRLGIPKACAPVCAMQGARAIKIHCPWNVIEIIEIGGIVVTHGFSFFFLKDLE